MTNPIGNVLEELPKGRSVQKHTQIVKKGASLSSGDVHICMNTCVNKHSVTFFSFLHYSCYATASETFLNIFR